MEKIKFQICKIPAVLWGTPSKNLYLYIHGQGGNKEEAEVFANIACQHSWQVLSIDLPEHGERMEEINSFDPWHVVPELHSVMEYVRGNWKHISLFANSIGAWFGMLSLKDEPLEKSLFVSPVLDMAQLISKMMIWAVISERQLEHERIIPTSFGQTLSWEYLQYARENPILSWNVPTQILYGEKDNLVEFSVIKKFARTFNSNITVMKGGEHWFHSAEQLDFLTDWAETCLNNNSVNSIYSQKE